MPLQLTDITFDYDKVFDRLNSYMFRLSNYDNFDREMELRIYVNKNREFIALESVRYNLNFVSNTCKISDIISSPYLPIHTTFAMFDRFLSHLS